MKIKPKMLLSFSANAVILLILGIVGIYTIGSMQSSIENLGQNRIPDLQSLGELNTERMAIRAQTMEVLLTREMENPSVRLQEISEQRRASWDQVDRAWARLQEVPRHNQRGRDIVAQLGGEYRAWRAIYVELDRLIQELERTQDESAREPLYTAYEQTVARMVPLSDAMGSTFVTLTENNTGNTAIMIARDTAFAERMERVNMVVVVFGIVASLALGWLFANSFTRPIQHALEKIARIAQGDLTERLTITAKDELGMLADAMNQMTEYLQDAMKNLADYTTTLGDSSSDLLSTSSQLAASAEETSAQSAQVASAGEQLSANMNNMSEGVDDLSTSAHTVASAIEEMTASINEVAKNCEQELRISRDASEKASEAGEVMKILGDAAQQIGKVVEVINSIADQTNLLALNATIEAASAGEAGKGFAVVANEVKELARQSRESTEEIASRIKTMQSNTSKAIESIAGINDVITEIGHISESISAAVEEQSSTSHEIAKTVGVVSDTSREISNGVRESAEGAKEVSRNIAGVQEASHQVAAAASQSHSSANNLARIAEELQQLTNRFTVS